MNIPNWLTRLVGELAVIFSLTCLFGIVGVYLFGYPFYDGHFGKWDYGVFCGVISMIVYRIVDIIYDVLETEEEIGK